MARVGNHGQIIPRDRTLLHRLYIVEKKTLSEMARMFGVTSHKSVGNVLRKMGFPMPGQGNRPHRSLCIDCGLVPPLTLKHKLTKNGTGTLCHDCLKKYKAAWLRNAVRLRPEVKARRKELLKRWYVQGPIQPTGEDQWIRKSKHLLRTNRRLLAEMTAPAHSKSQSAVSAPEQTSPT